MEDYQIIIALSWMARREVTRCTIRSSALKAVTCLLCN